MAKPIGEHLESEKEEPRQNRTFFLGEAWGICDGEVRENRNRDERYG